MNKIQLGKTKSLCAENDISHRNMDGKTLKELRLKLNFTQSQLAEKLGVSRSAIAKYEAGEVMRKSVSMLAEQLAKP